MSRFDSFCASCGYQLTKDGDSWTGCQCAKLAELEERGANIVDLDEENTRLRAALARIEALQPVHPTTQVYETDTGLARAFGRWEASAIAHVTLDDQYDADGKARGVLA